MQKNEIETGKVYSVKVSGKMTELKVKGAHHLGGWRCLNMRTNRTVRVKTARRFREEVKPRNVIWDYGTSNHVHGYRRDNPILRRVYGTRETGNRLTWTVDHPHGWSYTITFDGTWRVDKMAFNDITKQWEKESTIRSKKPPTDILLSCGVGVLELL